MSANNSIWQQIKLPTKLIISLLVFLSLGIMLILSATLNIWVDEAYSLHTTDKDLGYALSQAISFELQPPLYFVILNLWRSLNDSVFFARLFSILCVLLTLYVATKLSKRFLKGIHSGWIVAAIALNHFIIWAGVEIRVYALIILLSAVLLLFFFDGYLSEIPKVKAQWWYVLFSVLALYTQYYLAFLLVANACSLLILRRWQAFRNYLIGMIVVALGFLPMLLIVPSQVSTHTGTIKSSYSFLDALKHISRKIIGYILRSEWIPFAARKDNLFYIIPIFIFLIILWQMYKNRRLITSNDIALCTITSILSILFATVLNLTGEELSYSRHTTVLFMPLMLFVLAVIKISVFPTFKSINKNKILAIWTAITLFFNVTSLYVTYQPMAKAGDYNRVVSYLTANEKPNQPILVFNAELALPLSYQYSGKNKILPIPKVEEFKTYDLHNFVLKDEKEILTALSQVPGDRQDIWLLTGGNCVTLDIDFNCQVLEDFVSKYYSVEFTKYFYHSELKFLRRRPNF